MPSKKGSMKDLIAAIEKTHGSGSAFQIGKSKLTKIDAVPSGSLTLDLMTSIGGFPRGRITEAIGVESGGKSTICLLAIAEAQRAGGFAAYIDAEQALSQAYAKKLGVVIEDVLITQPDCGEQALDIVEKEILSGMFSIIIVDSVAALVPKAELEGEFGSSFMGLQARMMGQAMRKLAGAVRKSNTALVFINQIREKIGVVFGSPLTTPGGRALKFYASLRIDVSRVTTLKDDDKVIGARTRIKIIKSKVGHPFQEGEFDLLFGRGISRPGEILDLGEAEGLLQKNGAHYSYGETKLGAGRERSKAFLDMNPDLAATIEAEIKEKYRATGRLA